MPFKRHFSIVLFACIATSALAATNQPTTHPPVTSMLLLFGLLAVTARLGGMLCDHWRLPFNLGELAAGFLLSPLLLGKVSLAGLRDGLGPMIERHLPIGGTWTILVQVALLSLLFMMGLETDVRLARRRNAGIIGFGVLGNLGAIVLTFLGLFVLRAFLLAESSPDTWIGSLFLTGVALSFASTGTTTRMLSRLRKLETPEGADTMVASIADHLSGVFWLIAATGYFLVPKNGSDPLGIAWRALWHSAVTMVPIGVLCFWAAARAARTHFEPRNTAGIATLVFALAMLAAGVLGQAGMSALGGAYLTGVALAGSDWRHAVQEKLELLHTALVPTTIALFAMLLPLDILSSSRVWLLTAVLLVCTVAGKALGSRPMAGVAGYNQLGWLRISSMLLPRGEITLTIAATSYFTGLCNAEIAMAMVLLVIATELAALPVLHKVFIREKSGLIDGDTVTTVHHQDFPFPSYDASRAIVARLIDVFETEGFHVRLINRRAAIFQLIREDVTLGLRTDGDRMIVDCAATDRPLVNGAMVEVLAGIERHLLELRRPLDAIGLVRGVQFAAQLPRASVAIVKKFLGVNTLRPRLMADTKAAAITELIEMLNEEGLIHDRHAALNDVVQREEGFTTGLEHGVALPHARTAAVDRLVCAIGLKREGIDFGCLDGQPARIVVLLLAPLHKPAPMLQAIAGLSGILNSRWRTALLACDTAEDMQAVLQEAISDSHSRQPRQGKGALACLQWHSIGLNLTGRNRESIIDQLLALCSRTGAVTNTAEVRQALLAREHKSSTGMEHGVALPHARTEAVDRMVCALGISREGVDFGAMDGKPSRIFVMVLMPQDAAGDYARLTGRIARALDEEGRREIMQATNIKQVMAVLERDELSRAEAVPDSRQKDGGEKNVTNRSHSA